MPISSSGGKGGRSCRSFLCPCPEKTGDTDNKAAVTVASLRVGRENTRPSPTKQDQALIVMKKCRLGGSIILRSSKNCYHVVFDRYVSWEDNLSAVGWFSVLSHNPKVKDYLVMQRIKKASTLRVVPMKEKPSPRLVYRFGCQDHAVRDSLRFRQLIKRIYRSLH